LNIPSDPDFWPWVAGFWEGEGSAQWERRGTSTRTRLSIAQVSRIPLDYIVAQSGLGKVYFRRPSQRRTIPVGDHGCHIWYLNRRRDCLDFAREMLPHVRFRDNLLQRFIDETDAFDKAAKWHQWSQSENKQLIADYATASWDNLIHRFGRSEAAIKERANRLGIRRRRLRVF